MIDVYEKEISTLEAERRLVAEELARANRNNEPPPPTLDLDRVSTYLADLRAVLNQEIPAAADALRLLTGPISVTEEPYTTGKKGAHWILTFTPSAMPLLRDVAMRLSYPDSRTLEFLTSGKWITLEPVEIRLDSSGWRTRRMPPEFYDRLNEVIANNPTANPAELARKAGCSRSAVSRHLKRREEERGVRPDV